MKSIHKILENLGLNKKTGLFIFQKRKWEGLFSQKIEYALNRIEPDAFFIFNGEPLILFFDYPENEKEVHKQCWNFNKAPIIFINSATELKIYNGFAFDKNSLSLVELAPISELKKFSYWNIVSGQLWNEYENQFLKAKRVDFKLLENIEVARDILIGSGLDPSIANKLIGRLIFIRYLIDRKIKIGYSHKNDGFLTTSELLKLLLDKNAIYDLFRFLLDKFKGELFPLNSEKNSITQKHLKILYRLFRGEDLKSGQLSLFDIYDFDIIPIELISNIYEYFIGKDRKERTKAFYTPPFLVDYILSQTVHQHFNKTKNRNSLSCKILDPACGSGIFLVETLRILILRFKELYPHIKPSQKRFKDKIKELLVNNIFGIDRDEDALEIAIFSLYITLLDFFEEPKDIEGFEFPALKGQNIIQADFFDTEHHFNRRFGNGKNRINLDFIIGNPPWGEVDSRYKEYIEKREKKENKRIKISNKEIAQSFLIRVSDFSNRNTKCSLIITSKILYNLQAAEFRSYFLENFYVNKLFEISSVRKFVFPKSTGPATILFYQFAFGKDTLKNAVKHIALKPNRFFILFKSILIEKSDHKVILQSYFREYDWLWKVLVYGSVLDFYFIKRLRNPKYFRTTIGKIIVQTARDKDKLICGSKGVCIGNKENDAAHLLGMQFIQNNQNFKDLRRYYIHFRRESKWDIPKAERPREEKFFKEPPMLLIKKGLNPNFKLVASLSDTSAVFTDTIYAIKSCNGNNILNKLLGLINSELMAYYIFMTGSSTGIEREQFFNKELYSFPVVFDNKISINANKLLELNKRKYESNHFNLNGFQEEIQLIENQLNELIFNLYNLDKMERDLIDYAFNISIPILQNKSNIKPYMRLTKNQLKYYVELFAKHFSQSNYGNESSYIQAEVYQTKHIIAVNFMVTKDEPEQIIIWNEKNDSAEVIELLAAMAFQKISNNLFIQKDIKGIRRRSFYVIKPNQYKYWHKAIARLDIIEFENAMIESQIEHYQDEQV